MICKIEKSKLAGKIICPSNKSYTHRAIIIASLSSGKSTINNVLFSKDTCATIDACKKFGANICRRENSLEIEGIKNFQTNDLQIDALNSGTTIRIAAAIASLSKNRTVLTGDESLRQRPMQILLDALESIGAQCSSNMGKPPITVSGISKGGEINVPGNVSSQFISAIMIIAPKTEKGITLNVIGDLVSKPYLDATISMMEKFNVKIITIIPYRKYKIDSQEYKGTTVTIPTDFSSLALLLSAAVLIGEDLTFDLVKGEFPQGDEKIIEILKNLGVIVNLSNETISIKSPKLLKGGKFDLKNNPDLLPPLSILALKSSKPIELYNVKHARYKETDRISILSRELKKLGIVTSEKEDGIIVDCGDKLIGAKLNSENDHRLFMAFCIAGMFLGNCQVTNPESIEISYPNFISDMKSVGGKIISS